jgi:hypothetical protein
MESELLRTSSQATIAVLIRLEVNREMYRPLGAQMEPRSKSGDTGQTAIPTPMLITITPTTIQMWGAHTGTTGVGQRMAVLPLTVTVGRVDQ